MGKTRIHLTIAPSVIARLDALAQKYGWDRSGAASYCFTKICEEEGINPNQKKLPPEKYKP